MRTVFLAAANIAILAAMISGIAGRPDLAVTGIILGFILGGLALLFPGKSPNGGGNQ